MCLHCPITQVLKDWRPGVIIKGPRFCHVSAMLQGSFLPCFFLFVGLVVFFGSSFLEQHSNFEKNQNGDWCPLFFFDDEEYKIDNQQTKQRSHKITTLDDVVY